MPFVTTEGADIWYEDRGAGEPVLLIHGGLFDPMDGERFWIRPGIADDLIAAGYRVLIPDRRYGSGSTCADFRAHSWQIEADDFIAVLVDAGVPAAHVVTGSNGCSAAVWLALTRPAALRAVVLCWPASPNNISLCAAFERSAVEVATVGPAAYLEWLRAGGLPRPGDARAGFPFGAALLRDERAASSFLALSAADAAAMMRATAQALLPGEVLRGVSRDDMQAFGCRVRHITLVPAEPETPFHTRAAADALAAALPTAIRAAGVPVAPSPQFGVARAAFVTMLRDTFSAASVAANGSCPDYAITTDS